MLNALLPYIGWIVLAAVAIIILLMLWKKAPQDKAIVVTGLKRRVISGSGGIVIPYLEQTSRISLENIKVEVKTHESLDSNGVPIDTDGVAIIKVNSDPKSVLLAVEQFNTGREKETINVIKETVQLRKFIKIAKCLQMKWRMLPRLISIRWGLRLKHLQSVTLMIPKDI